MKKKTFTCDVDGILNDYPLCWLRYLAERCGTLYETTDLAKTGEKDYRQYKDEYRNSSYKAHLPVHRMNRDVINQICSQRFYEVVMVTSRPILNPKYPQLYEKTYQWLINSGLKFTHFDFKDPEVNFLQTYSPISFHIDDDPEYAKKVADCGTKVYLLKSDNWDFSSIKSYKRIIIVKELSEILSYE